MGIVGSEPGLAETRDAVRGAPAAVVRVSGLPLGEDGIANGQVIGFHNLDSADGVGDVRCLRTIGGLTSIESATTCGPPAAEASGIAVL